MKIKLLLILSVFFLMLFSVQAQTSFSYNGFSFCVDDPIEAPIINGQSGGIFTSMPGLSLDAVTGAIYPIASAPGMYTITYTVPANGSNPAETSVVAVEISPGVVPVFNQIGPICSGSSLLMLPPISLNGISGTWSPATVSNEFTSIYTFTPNPGQCAMIATIVIVVVPVEMAVITGQDNHDYIYVEGTTVVQPLLLSTSLNGNYNYQWYESGVAISGANQATYLVNTHKEGGIQIYSVRATDMNEGCVSNSTDFVVQETPVPAPLGNQDQTFTPGQTLADVVVQGQNIQWYDGLGRNVNANPLPLSTVLVDGATYYASQTINGHESPDRLTVTIHLNVMANTTFDSNVFMIVPNPVKDQLNIESKQISQVEIYNLMGQKLISTTTSKVMMQSLPSGVYIVQITTKDGQQSLRVVKE